MRRRLLGIVLATVMILSGTIAPGSAKADDGFYPISRLAGQNHIETSAAIAQAYNNDGECGNVILASGNNFPDALSASLLSIKYSAPILLVGGTVTDSTAAFNYLYTHASRQRGTVYIIGGTGVIGPDFETKLASMGYTNIKRLGGTDRYDTNMLIINDVNVPHGTPVFIASGENFPDALSVASYSGLNLYPTLLVGANYLPEKTKHYLLTEQPSAVYIAGGTSVVSQDLETKIESLVPNVAVTRLAGADRFGTNAAVLNKFSVAPDTIYIAGGDDFPDVLAGSALAAKTGNPIILVDDQSLSLPPAVAVYLKKINGSGIQPDVIALGNADAVSDKLVTEVKITLKEKPQKIVNSRITLGAETVYYLDSSGHVWSWGDGGCGELGNGTTGTPINSLNNISIYGSTVPVEVTGLSNIISVAAGVATCYALDSHGHVWAWGFGSNGELGNGAQNSFTNTPVEVSSLKNIVSIAAGESTGYALDSSGHIWVWGLNISGQFGSQNAPMSSSVPLQISTLTNINSIDAEGYETYAVDSSGRTWAWGLLGSNGFAKGLYNTSVPVQISSLKDVTAIATGGINARYTLDSSGQVWAWEYLSNSLSNGTVTDIQITSPVPVPNLTNIMAIAGRDNNSEAVDKSGYALDSSGCVWSWGEENFGELGNGMTTENQPTPVKVSNISNIVAITGGFHNGYALSSSGQVWAWGLNNIGQLGNGTTTDSNVPVQVLGLPK